jgi:hypothetical protein
MLAKGVSTLTANRALAEQTSAALMRRRSGFARPRSGGANVAALHLMLPADDAAHMRS